jgi:hypothetical protein
MKGVIIKVISRTGARGSCHDASKTAQWLDTDTAVLRYGNSARIRLFVPRSRVRALRCMDSDGLAQIQNAYMVPTRNPESKKPTFGKVG